MKNHILRQRAFALAALVAAGTLGTVAQAQFSDDFNGETDATMPSNWTEVDGDTLMGASAGAGSWLVGSDPTVATYFPNNGDSSNFAYFDDDGVGSGQVAEDVAILSPVVDTSSFDVLNLSYNYYFRALGTSALRVYVYDGATWQEVAAYTATAGWAPASIDVAAYKNANFQIAFRYDDGADWAWGAAIDDVQLVGAAGSSISIADGSVLEGDSGTTLLSFPVSAVPAPVGNIMMDYDITLDGNADAADIASPLTGTYTFVGDGATTMGSLNIDINGDEFPEPNESFSIAISNPDSGAIIGGTATGTILDDDFTGVISEDFTSVPNGLTPPAGWTLDSPDLTTEWRFQNPWDNSAARAAAAPLSAPFAIIDTDDSQGTADSALVSPSFSLAGFALASLRFDHIFRPYSGFGDTTDEFGDVEYSLNGTDWTLLAQFGETNPAGNPTTGAPASESIDLSAAAGQATVQVRFRYYDADFDYYWIVDNIEVVGGTLPAGISTVTIGSATIGEDGTRGGGLQIPVTANPAATGDLDVNWSITGGTATSGVNYGGPMSGMATILSGQTTGTIDIPVMDDSTRSGPLTVEVTIDSVSANGFLASTQVGTGSIVNTQAIATDYLFGFDYFVNGGGDPAAMFEGDLASFGATFSFLGDAADPNLGLGGDFVNNDFSTFYYVAGTGATGELVAVDTTSMLPTVVGALSGFDAGHAPNGFAWDIETGDAYVASSDGAGGFGLYTINLGTAVVTKVADITGAAAMSEISIDGATGQMYSADLAGDQLLQINKTTGAATVVGAFGFDANFFPGMDFDDSTGTGYIAVTDNTPVLQGLYSINTSTGALTIVEAVETNQGLGQSSAIGFAITTPPFSSVSDWMSFE